MATYKVIQDIEAEDKLIGPLTLRQSIYGGIAALFGYLSFVVATKVPLLLIIFLPPTLFSAFFAFPWGRDQSTEIWALAKIRFYIKARKRLWDQSGVKDLVTITVPKKQAKAQTNGLSDTEVQSRLNALASTLDTRGWAIKNVYTIPPLVAQQSTDRLIDVDSLPKQVSPLDITYADDMLDADNNAQAHRLQEMVAAAGTSHKQSLLEHMQHGDMPSLPAPAGQPAANYWYTNNPIAMPQPAAAITENDVVLSDELHERRDNDGNNNLKMISPLPPAGQPAAAMVAASPPVTTPAPDPATIHLSQRDDLNISTIARIAKGEDMNNEVVVSLH